MAPAYIALSQMHFCVCTGCKNTLSDFADDRLTDSDGTGIGLHIIITVIGIVIVHMVTRNNSNVETTQPRGLQRVSP